SVAVQSASGASAGRAESFRDEAPRLRLSEVREEGGSRSDLEALGGGGEVDRPLSALPRRWSTHHAGALERPVLRSMRAGARTRRRHEGCKRLGPTREERHMQNLKELVKPLYSDCFTVNPRADAAALMGALLADDFQSIGSVETKTKAQLIGQ